MRGTKNTLRSTIGIFWIFKEKLLKLETALQNGSDYAGVIHSDINHIDYWPVLQRRMPELKQLEYEDVPRGRVMFFKRTKKYRVLMDKVLHTPRNKQLLLKAFNLPKAKTVFGTDPHYTTDPKELDRLFAHA